MTVNDFIARLNKLGITGDEPLIVSCFGGLTCNRNVIEHVHKGFDWHMGCVVLQPTHAVTLMPKKGEKVEPA